MKTRLIVAALAFQASFHAAAASFDCAKAKSRLEVLICSEPRLSALDQELADAYRAALSKTNDRKTLIHWQRDWLNSDPLSSCRDANCASREFRARIAVLDRVVPEDAATGWTGSFIRVLNGKDDQSSHIVLIRLAGERLSAAGTAYWVGANPGQINSGELIGTADIEGGRATFRGDGCEAVFALRQGKLFVESESGCGGLNVSFVGEYRRK
jgi:uncharacterized protein